MAVNSEKLDSRVWLMMHRAHDVLKICEDKVFGERGLTAEQYAVLAAIKCTGEPARVTDVARWLTRSANSVSMMADRMAKAGLLRRVRDRADRREVHLLITSKAGTLLEPATVAGEELIQKVLSQMPHEDRRTLVRLLELLEHGASGYLDGQN
ncbi:MAG: hypothetical protein CVV27_02615 [Candidatus Melainabacteria bacterium HGW-Melainabacteria-1]|nr:MAG: hypothetical protein CVV27_02615 [Candidatus Melainabacteria bacterium HGW-Melainabacteria-1]